MDRNFLEWFVGFAEGDGSFICTTNARAIFCLKQKEKRILQRIRSQLGFGKVSTYGDYSRYTVADKVSVDRLISLFNGNLCLGKTHGRFSIWCHWANRTRERPCTPRPRLLLSQEEVRKTSWLAGFIDAEGCFNAQQIQDPRYTLGYRVCLRFLLYQRGEQTALLLVRDLLGGGSVAIRPEMQKDCAEKGYMWRLSTWSLRTHAVLISYLQSHPLRSKRRVDHKRFVSLYNYITTQRVMPWQGKVLSRVENLLSKLSVVEGQEGANE